MPITGRLRTSFAVAAFLVVGTGSLLAHHGWTGYEDKALTLAGTVKASAYENPHSYIDLEASGKVWRVVLAPPSRMENRGLSKEAIKPGTQATVMGYPHKSQANELRAERITIAGKTTELR